MASRLTYESSLLCLFPMKLTSCPCSLSTVTSDWRNILVNKLNNSEDWEHFYTNKEPLEHPAIDYE